MPIIRFKEKIVYFSHIPKCGGTSIENFLEKISGNKPSFLNRKFYDDGKTTWSISSPQHILGNDIYKLFPMTFFDEFFTVTRHPIDRFCSAFAFHKHIVKRIPIEMDINEFIVNSDKLRILQPGNFDNHFLPQVSFFFPHASYKVFKLENGLDVVKKYLSNYFEIDLADEAIPHSLRQPKELKEIDQLSQKSIKAIKSIYRLDFEKLNYSSD